MDEYAVPSSYENDSLELSAMPHQDERVELEMQIMKYRQLDRRIVDDQFQQRLRQPLAELEQKLREIDE